ncbi:circadian clock-controlled protein-like [Diaphorina citri]|uniref:Circadian clock-controlled protein-like n=1 Tax=Diaphorina citri TaxID=121845 RepID=A0A1S3CX04_DIACI|nr:circadian clock-controlled protein-like [Diaphorina citri]
MYIPRMEVEQHEGMKMKKVLTDITITGLKDAKLDKADFTKLPDSIEMTWEVPELRIKNNYSMDGVIMGVPYKGKGQSFFNCTGVRNMVKLKTELVKMDGQDYLQVKDIKYTTEAPKTAHVMFTNTLSKDPKLTEATVKFFNENWRSLFEMFKNVRNGNVEKFMKDTMNKALAKFPYEEMFPK